MTAIVTVIVASTLLVTAANSRTTMSGLWRFLLNSFAVILVSIIAGIRNIDTSTDMVLYGNDVFTRVSAASDFGSAMTASSANLTDGEVGYIWLNFAVGQLGGDHSWFYFTLAAVGAGVVMLAIHLLRSYGIAPIMWLTYLCTAYLDSFNLLRQGPALALALLGIAVTLRKKPWIGLLLGASALLFHTSALVFLPMWVATAFLMRTKRASPRAVIFVIIMTLVASAGASYILELVGGALADTKYAYYLEQDTRVGLDVGVDALYRLVPIVVALGVLWRGRQESDPVDEKVGITKQFSPSRLSLGAKVQFAIAEQETGALTSQTPSDRRRRQVMVALLILLIIELIMLPIREVTFALYRVPLYFGYVRILAYGVIIGQIQKNRGVAVLGTIVFIGAYFFILLVGRSGFEYESTILDQWLAL